MAVFAGLPIAAGWKTDFRVAPVWITSHQPHGRFVDDAPVSDEKVIE